MKKSFYASLMVLAAAGGLGFVASADSADQAVLFGGAGVDYSTLKPYYASVESEKEFDVPNGKCVVKLKIAPPTQGINADYDFFDMVDFSKLVLTRQLGYNGTPTVLKEWSNVKAGDILEFTDDDPTLEMGKEYTYYAIAYNGEIKGNEESEYVFIGVKPVMPDSPVVKMGENGGLPVDITYKCPELAEGSSWNSTPMPEGITYTKLELFRKGGNYSDGYNTYDILATIENPEPGKEYTARDENPQMNAQNVYGVRTFTLFGNSVEGTTYVYIGKDAPGRPNNVAASELKDGTVMVTWDAVTEGYNRGDLDPESVRYRVWRKMSAYDNEPLLLAEDLTETSCIDKLEGIDKEVTVFYRVQAYNEIPPSSNYNYTDMYTGLKVGPPTTLPFRETFNSGVKMNKVYDNGMEFTYDYAIGSGMVSHSQSYTVDGEEFTVVSGVDGGDPESDKGCDNYFIVRTNQWYTSYGGTGTLSTPGIDLSSAVNPNVSISYVSVAGSTAKIIIEMTDNSLGEDNKVKWDTIGWFMADDNYKAPEPETPDPAALVAKVKAAEAEASLWKTKVFSAKKFAGTAKAKMRVNITYPEGIDGKYPTFIDNLFLEDYPGVTDVAVAAEENGELKLTWKLPESASDATGVKYNVYNGETLLGTVETAEYIFKDAEQGESYSFSVEAVYSNGIVSDKSEPVVYAIPVTAFTAGDYEYTVDGETAVAAKYVGETDSTVLPAEVEYKGVKYAVSVSAALYNGNRTLKNLDIKAAMTEMPAEFCYGAVALEAVKLPATLEKIGEKAFFGNAALKSIEFPEALKEIGASAFQNCEALEEVHFATATPPTVGADAFTGIKNPCKGYCPEGSEDAYAAVENMKTITFKEQGVHMVGVDGAVSVEYYNLNGARIAEPQIGQPSIARYRMADGTVKTVKVIKNRK